MQRDCGTGNDPGCQLSRGGALPMDRGTFQGLMTSLQNTPSELSREQMVGNVLVNNGITALQLGQVLDQFRSEVSKMNVAKKAAPRVADPGNAIGHSVKFRSSINQTEYVKLMSAQR
jgi:sRNA-binding protein